MARYTINYLTGHEETVTADGVEYDSEASDYTFTGPDGRGVVAIVPACNVLSIHRQQDEAVTGCCGAPAGALCVHDANQPKAVTG